LIRSILPYPFLAASLLAMWTLLNGFSAGHLVLGGIVAVVASQIMVALDPEKPRLRRWYLLPKLLGVVAIDVLRSNIAVATLVLWKKPGRKSGFVVIPLELQQRTSLALLACIITATPGTTWVEYHSTRRELLIHVLDLVENDDYVNLIKGRYESLIGEIFE
jgi:multicomponent K+:H+ antiporter subunit E